MLYKNLELPNFIFLVGLITYLSIRGVFQYRIGGAEKVIKKDKGRERMLVFLVVTSQVVLPLLFLFSPFLSWANIILPKTSVFLGIPLLIAGLWLFLRAHADLGKNWSVALELNGQHQLITYGVYRFIRHPMYASFFLLGFSQGLLLQNWFAGWAALAAVSVMYRVRVSHEEQMMLECFGSQYQDYIESTGALIPRTHGYGKKARVDSDMMK